MQQLKDRISEVYSNKNVIEDEQAKTPEELRQEDLNENLKPAIDHLLQRFLPGHLTVDQCETLAFAISDLIYFPDEYLPKK